MYAILPCAVRAWDMQARVCVEYSVILYVESVIGLDRAREASATYAI